MSEPVRCKHCAGRIVLVDVLVGPPQWRHNPPAREQFVNCHRWPYPPAEPEPWTVTPEGQEP